MTENNKKLRLVSNNSKKIVQQGQSQTLNWLFNSQTQMTLKDAINLLDIKNTGKRIMQLEWIMQAHPEIFNGWEHPVIQDKLGNETFHLASEIIANLAYDYLLAKQYKKAADLFERLVYTIDERDEENFDYLIAYLSCLASTADSRRIEALMSRLPDIETIAFYYLPYFYVLFINGEYQRLDQFLKPIDLVTPNVIDLFFQWDQIIELIGDDTIDVDQLPFSEDEKDFISAIYLYQELELDLSLLFDYVYAKYTHFDPKRVNFAQLNHRFDQ